MIPSKQPRRRAVDLYTLNTQLSEALYTPLQTLEIALRNRIHTVMSAAAGGYWFDQIDFQQGRQAEQLAKSEGQSGGRVQACRARPGRCGADIWILDLAFFGCAYDEFWRNTLHQIAMRPNGKRLGREDFSRPLTPIRILRNRIAHHEPILSWNLSGHHRHVLELIEWLPPTIASWCRSISRFDTLYPAAGIELHSPPGATSLAALPGGLCTHRGNLWSQPRTSIVAAATRSSR